MPRYVYRCAECEEIFEVTHSMNHTQEECLLCDSEKEITKIPAPIGDKMIEKERKTGEIVKQYIKDASSDLRSDKKFSNKEFK